MTSAYYDIAGTVASTGDGKPYGHIAWQLWAVVGATLMDVVELTALGQLRVLVDRYLMSDAEEEYDDLQHDVSPVGRCSCCSDANQGVPRRTCGIELQDTSG